MLALKTNILIAGFALGAVLVIAVAASPLHLHILNPGTMTPGHQDVGCQACHVPSGGTARQQIRANLAYLLGWRRTSVAFGYEAPADAACNACHARPDDAHPPHRFAEPRFAEALKTLSADTCLGCHQEHRGVRVSSGAEFCSGCHGDLEVRKDPLDVSHHALTVQQRWDTCLGCHDYHGNHARTAQTNLADAYDVETIRAYLAAGPDPYARTKRYPAKDEP